MSRWQRQQGCWCLWPASAQGLVEFIGGSYLATNPQISYRRLLEGLAARQLAVHAWSYVPGFDHQLQPEKLGRLYAPVAQSSTNAWVKISFRCVWVTAWAASYICWPRMEVATVLRWPP